MALFPKILFKIVILHNIKRLFPKNLKNYEFSKKLPIWRLQILTFSGLAQFSVLTHFHYFGFFGIILSRSMGENSVILKISPFGYTSLSKSCIWSFCHFCPMHNFLLWLIWKIQLFLAILEKSLPENHASILFCHFGIHSNI